MLLYVKETKLQVFYGSVCLPKKRPLTPNTFLLKMYYILAFMAQGLGYLVSFVEIVS